MRARLVEVVGVRAYLRRHWGEDCPSNLGTGRPGYHDARLHLADGPDPGDWLVGGEVEDHGERAWPTACDHCGAPVPPDAERQVHRTRLYNTASGHPEPGDLYWADWYHDTDRETGEVSCLWWDDCRDPRGHLMGVMPDGTSWDCDSRASNCAKPEDRGHRCWVRHGEPPDVTVDKNGTTCAAGAGSIVGTRGYHGFLVRGRWT